MFNKIVPNFGIKIERERERKRLRRFLKLSLAFFVFLYCFLQTRSLVYATDYYVDSSITDTNSASAIPDFTTYDPNTFETTGGSNSVYKTIADINLKSFSPGDNIYFRKGNTWREQLTISSSGSSGNVITFTNYGNGNNPKIIGSNILDVSGYIAGSVTDPTIYTNNVTNSVTDSATRNYRHIVPASSITASASTIKIKFCASATTNAVITGTSIGPQSSGANATSLTRVTWDSGNNGTTISAATCSTSDQLAYSLNNSVNQVITLYTTARNFKFGSGDVLYYNSTASDQSQNASVTGYSQLTNNGLVSEIISVGGSLTNTYHGSQLTDPGYVWEDNVPLSKQASSGNVDANSGSWYWDSGAQILYLHASNDSNVANNGKVYEIYGRDHCIDTNNNNYITIDGIDCTQTAGNDSTLGGIKVTGSNTTIQNLTSYGHRRHALSFYTGATSSLGTNLTLYDSYVTTPVSFYDTTTNNNTLQNSTVYNSTINPNNGLIVVHGGADNTIIQGNTLYDAGNATYPKRGIDLYSSGTTNVIIRRNVFYGVFNNVINAANITGLEIYNNIFRTTSSTSTGIALDASTGSHIYNNSFYGTSTPWAITQINSSTGTLVKNNIFYNGRYIFVEDGSQTDSTYNYNDYFGGTGTFFSWRGTGYTSLENWKTNSSQDANSISSDPLYTNASSQDFTLLSSSPAKDAGTDVSLTTDYLGTTIPQGSAPDIGAYEYDATAPTISSVSSTPTSSTATITWTTNESASTKIDYGLTNSYGSTTTETDTSTRVTSHSDSITSLASCTTYHYRVRSKDAALNETIGTDNTFTTIGCTGSATVDSQTSSSITTVLGGSISLLSDSKGVTLTVPASFAGSDANFQIKQLDKTSVINITSTPTGYSVIGSYLYDLKALTDLSTSVSSFNNAITVSIVYGSSDVSGIDESSLKIYRWDGSNWNQLTGCSVNTSTKTVSCTTTAFSVFGLFGQASSSTSSSSSSSSSSSTSAPSCGDQAPGSKVPWLYGAIAQDSGSVLLYFTEADNPVNKYVLEYGTKSGDYPYGVQDMGVNSRGQMTFLVKSLSPSTTYYFKVRGGNGCAVGNWSNELSAKTKGIVSLNRLEITESELKPVEKESKTESCQTYTVKAGDNLWSIAKELLGDGNVYREIIDQNKNTYSSLKTSNNLIAGWELKVNCGKLTVTKEGDKTEPEIQGDYEIKVKVIDINKKPVEGAKVTIHSKVQEALTNNDGVAEFKNVESGDHKVLITYNNYEGEQSFNLTGGIKKFDLNVTIQQKAIALSPLAYGIIGVMGIVIFVLIFLLIKTRKQVL